MIRRPRRLRTTHTIRNYTRETAISKKDLIYPLFLIPGQNQSIPVQSMPGISKMTVDLVLEEISLCIEKGVEAFILFATPHHKDNRASMAYNDDNILQKAIRAIKSRFPDVWLIADICVCSYTDHGHCGIMENNEVLNDVSLDILSKMALSCAKAGIDTVAPSAMMDGQVAAIRSALDAQGYTHVSLMSYSAKYFSAFYGPFREAADSAPQVGDRSTYQMDPGNSNEAVLESGIDVEEGADFIMVKPAMSYMDIIQRLKENFLVPVVAYNVSGEYAMVKAAAEKGWVDEEKVVRELLLSFKRAGADLIITYFAKDFT